jgi:aspartyl-tRNA(Asn)/glutamyl-tRNA(Gln) amidotransferase subunit A
MTDRELLNLTLAEAARLVRQREVSPVHLVEACIAQAQAHDPLLRAFITLLPEQALQQARAAEAAMTKGAALGPLHGVPIALKDNIATAGSRTTAGSRILADWIPREDATVTARLRQAGAIVLGKLNMHEFAWGGTSDNPHYGTVRNPWNPQRFPAGSSGGSGVAVAARMCFGALGTDTGGSIRLPSAINGICGIRPTYGRVSNHGIIPLAWSMDTAGPMARTAEDCALMFQAIAGHDPHDPGTAAEPVDDYLAGLHGELGALRIGVISDYSFSHLQPAVGQAVRQALHTLQTLGAKAVELPIAHIHGNISAQLTIESAEPSTYHQRWLRERPQDYGDDVRTLLEVGEMMLATDYLQAQRYRSLLRAEFLRAFGQVDVFICPTLPFTATPVGATTVVIEGDAPEDMISAIMQFTGVPSLTGLPAISLPCGFDGDGMPIGMQLIGRPFAERLLFRIGAAYQRATGFHAKAPPLLA